MPQRLPNRLDHQRNPRVFALLPDRDWRWQEYQGIRQDVNNNEHVPIREYVNSIFVFPRTGINDCVVERNGNELHSIPCTNAYFAICVKEHNPERHPPFMASPIPTDPEICPQGYDSMGTVCISTGHYPRNYDTAKGICADRYGALYEPRTTWDLDRLKTFLEGYSWLYNARVNVVYKDNGWRFESDGQEIQASMWGENEPSMELDELCAIYNATSGRLSSASCTDTQHYLCVYQPKAVCPPGYLSFGWSSDCFLIGPVALPYASAQTYCENWGGEVASLRESYTRDSIYYFQYYGFRQAPNVGIWVDLNDRAAPGQFQYADGTMMQFWTTSNFNPAPPNVGQCVYQYSRAFVSAPCSNSYYPLCKASEGDCPAGFRNVDGQCFRYSRETRTWSLARSQCTYHSSDLSWTRDPSVLSDLMTFDVRMDYPYWLGGTDEGHEGVWTFVDNEAVEFTVESSGLPWVNGTPDGGNCLFLTKEGSVNDADCAVGYRYVCQATTELEDMPFIPGLLHDLQVTTPTCFEEDPDDPAFIISPGNYDPMRMSVTACKYVCLSAGYKYAAVKRGMFCFCSNILSLSRASTQTQCDASCSDSASGEVCGSTDGRFISVSGMFNVTLTADQTVDLIAGTPVTFTSNLGEGGDALVSLQYGDGNPYTVAQPVIYIPGVPPVASPVTTVYTYYLLGNYTTSVKYFSAGGVGYVRMG
ncbi:hypothetical protein C7M84_006987 [Penaeus vannamei]|uniref:Uncharacterized protein n=1 Tax=Penaeus vannamei TaxID=6689 RepID=A0A423TDE9_PENVA|nr:hypothetical protein C7M84_006987 [Penaeus vannamei]